MKVKIKVRGKKEFKLVGTMTMERILDMNPHIDRIEIEVNGERELVARDYPYVPAMDFVPGKQSEAKKKQDEWLADMKKDGWRFAGSWGYAYMKRIEDET
jgi:hypothetical protein